ncbi:MAG: pantoate--beta-alanine ligase [Rhodospirillales bacterium]|nr:pantoate--beta-alanine ligase [Rhodospirillales bacterium]
MDVVRTVADLRAHVGGWRTGGKSVALVPTMGALHAGHVSLVRRAGALAERTCVTLFVNPTQFAPHEDLDVYPRDEAADSAMLEAEGADLLFAPDVAEMYPEGDATRVSVPGLSDDLEGAFRPGFFTGVATVVTKLLIQALPDAAVFGEKDYQQLQVIRRLVRDLHIPVRIEAAETVREADGLALSSRNAYLSPDERGIAPALHHAVSTVASAVADGADADEQERRAVAALRNAGFARVDYVAVRDAATLAAWTDRTRPGRVLAAAHLGRTRLIDNVPVR